MDFNIYIIKGPGIIISVNVIHFHKVQVMESYLSSE